MNVENAEFLKPLHGNGLPILLVPGVLLFVALWIRQRRMVRPGLRSASPLITFLKWVMAAFLFMGSVGCIGGLLSEMLWCAPSFAHSTDCLSHLRQLSTGLVMYTQDWDDRFPPAAHWGDEAARRMRATPSLVRCPSSRSPYGYAFNRYLDRLPEDRIDNPHTVLLFEADAPSPNTAGDRTSLPDPRRHSGTSNYAYADGHVSLRSPTSTQEMVWRPKVVKAPGAH